MSADSEAMAALHALLDERQRYESWIQSLDQHRRNSPPHVYERVRGDYVERLNSVIRRMGEHADHLRTTIDALSGQLTQLREREEQRTEARQEAELRAVVGEYAPEEWEALRTEADAELGSIATERAEVERELSELQHILAMTSADAPMAPPASTANEPESESSIAYRPQQAASASSPASSEDSIAATPLFASQQDDGSATAAAAPTTPDGNAAAAVADAAVADEVPVAANGVAEKTLRCPECGTMNYATEWYCERCGGELATY